MLPQPQPLGTCDFNISNRFDGCHRADSRRVGDGEEMGGRGLTVILIQKKMGLVFQLQADTRVAYSFRRISSVVDRASSTQ